MNPVETRKICHALFYISTAGACLGLGLALMEEIAIGAVLMVACIASMMICLSILKFFGMYDFNHMLSSKKPKNR